MGKANRAVSEVKDKWKNLKRVSRRGETPSKPPSVSSKEIIEVFEDTPGFSGLNGFETDMLTIRLPLDYETCHVIIFAYSRLAMFSFSFFFFFRVVHIVLI